MFYPNYMELDDNYIFQKCCTTSEIVCFGFIGVIYSYACNIIK